MYLLEISSKMPNMQQTTARSTSSKSLVTVGLNGVWEFEGRVTRYGVSRGFWGTSKRRKSSKVQEIVAEPHLPECFCEECRSGKDVATGKQRRPVKTIRERVVKCGRGVMLFRVRAGYDTDGKCIVEQREMVGISQKGFWRSLQNCRGSRGNEVGMVKLRIADMRRLKNEFSSRDDTKPSIPDSFNRELCEWVPF